MSRLILASQSPRRRELLMQLGANFSVASADIDESVLVGEQAEAYVSRLAQAKARVIAQRHPATWVLGSDTTVVVEGEILGKPQDEEDAVRMLMRLSGRCHTTLTAVALLRIEGEVEQCLSQRVATQVRFRPLNEALCRRYWATGEPADKAGAYGIQGLGGALVESIEGSFSAVVGLPLCETAQLLEQAGLATWLADA
ncbi:Maf family protein [Balneatrix alpica]|uniref:dTTP/UTP pyrophosphatase n=1 Tax=Balneatrix alpica TaxID=75684 RepID=A0ABV5Z913_9GAMM|nr:Maf family protein [Balneatrix alpica]